MDAWYKLPNGVTWTFVVFATAIAVGCSHKGKQSTTSTAPALTGSNLSASGAGRSVFTSQCNTCHSLPSIGNYSATKWQSILPDMSQKARLSSADQQALQDYIVSVLNGS